MLPEVLPLRAIAFQVLFLIVAIAIEATVYRQMLKTSPDSDDRIAPKQSIQFAASVNLLSTVAGWIGIFLFFSFSGYFPPTWESALLNFIFFDRLSNLTASVLIIVGFATFFASFLVKQLGLLGLKWLLQAKFETAPPRPPEPQALTSTPIRDLRRVRSQRGSLSFRQLQDYFTQANAVLIANAWSYSAILLLLVLKFLT